MINATGTETLTGNVVTSALPQDELDNAFEQAFVRDLFEIAKSGC